MCRADANLGSLKIKSGKLIRNRLIGTARLNRKLEGVKLDHENEINQICRLNEKKTAELEDALEKRAAQAMDLLEEVWPRLGNVWSFRGLMLTWNSSKGTRER